MAKAFDPEVSKAGPVFFKDPVTKEDLSVDTPRVNSSVPGGDWIWPTVRASNGEEIKILYSLFTADEKIAYKEYRVRGSAKVDGSPSAKKVKNEKPKVDNKYNDETSEAVQETAEPVTYDETSAVSFTTKQLLAKVDKFLGCSYLAGLTYAVFTVKGSREQYHIPRACVPNELIEELTNEN